jgi:hypothetical protein
MRFKLLNLLTGTEVTGFSLDENGNPTLHIDNPQEKIDLSLDKEYYQLTAIVERD